MTGRMPVGNWEDLFYAGKTDTPAGGNTSPPLNRNRQRLLPGVRYRKPMRPNPWNPGGLTRPLSRARPGNTGRRWWSNHGTLAKPNQQQLRTAAMPILCTGLRKQKRGQVSSAHGQSSHGRQRHASARRAQERADEAIHRAVSGF